MKSYCVKQKKETSCVPGSERIRTAKNGRQMSVCVCSECGITKTKFIARKTGGAISNTDFSCGYDLKGKRAGTPEECFKKGQIRRWGIKKLDDGYIDALLADRIIERNEKARARRKIKKPVNALAIIEEPPKRITIDLNDPTQVRTVKVKNKKSKNTKAHIKEIIDKIPYGGYIELEDHVVINMHNGYTIVDLNLINNDEMLNIDFTDLFTFNEYIIYDELSETEAINIIYKLYKKKNKIELMGN